MSDDEMQSEGEGQCCPEHLCLCLGPDDLKKLGWKIPKTGVAVTISATGFIESSSIYGGQPNATIKISNMKAKLGADMGAKLTKAATALYGPESPEE